MEFAVLDAPLSGTTEVVRRASIPLDAELDAEVGEEVIHEHRHGAYEYLTNEQDRAMLPWVLKFNQYDLYSKGHTKPDVKTLKPYYDELFAEFLSEKVAW